MKKSIVVMVLVIAALAVFATGVASAQGPQPPAGAGRGMGDGPLHEYMVAAMAKALGITPAEFEAQRAAGKTAFEIALGLGIAADKIPALLSDARASALDAAAAAGVVTPQQAGWMRSRGGHMGGGNCDGTGQQMRQGRGGWRFQQANP